jgi:hypothetical protein
MANIAVARVAEGDQVRYSYQAVRGIIEPADVALILSQPGVRDFWVDKFKGITKTRIRGMTILVDASSDISTEAMEALIRG